MKRVKNKWGSGMLIASLLIIPAYATEQTAADATSDFAQKLSPQELAAIETEAAKLKDNKPTEQHNAPTEQAEQKSMASEEKSAQKKIARQRGIQRYETRHQGFYPGHEITQRPQDSLTER